MAIAGTERLFRQPAPIRGFFTTSSSDHRIIDTADQDSDTIPDFAERVYSCLVEAHKRYSFHYGLSQVQRETIAWMPLNYSDGTTNGSGSFHPVFLQIENSRGWNEPWFFRNLSTEVGLNKTYTNIDSAGRFFPATDAASPNWEYPALENVIYHEMFHAYQALFKEPNPWDAVDMWTYEGTAVYATEQALLLPCTLAPSVNNPVRILRFGGSVIPSGTALCNTPDIHERDSETRLNKIFREPWLGLRRDNGGGSTMAYESVLFWHYAQAKLQTQANDPNQDVIKSFWKTGRGAEATINEWAALRYPANASSPGGIVEMHHRFGIANYLRTVSINPVEYDHPYYTPWWTPTGSSAWAVDATNDRPINFSHRFSLSTAAPSDRHKDTAVEQLGVGYYAIDLAGTTPATATLEVKIQPLDVQSDYVVSLLDVVVDPSFRSPTTFLSASRLNPDGDVARISNFSGADRRAVLVVSGGSSGGNGYTIDVNLLSATTEYRPAVVPDVFSPNPAVDDRNSTTVISYTLPTFSSPTTRFETNLDLRTMSGSLVTSLLTDR
jgi:hypothetical protein